MDSPGFRRNRMLVRVVAPAVAGLVLLTGLGAVLWSNAVVDQATTNYQQKRQALNAELQHARQQGYASQDLEPVTSQVTAMDATQAPWWPTARPGYYDQRASVSTALLAQLRTLEHGLFTEAQTDAGKQLDSARAEITQDQQANAADLDVASLQQRLQAATAAQGAAHTLHDYRALTQQAQGILGDATTLFDKVQQENQAIQQAAQQLIPQGLAAIQAAGNAALAQGRNNASVAAYMNKPSPFKGYDVIQRAYNRLEKFAGMIGSPDVNQAAQGTAAAQKFANTIHDSLLAGLPGQAVIVSFQAQHMWAYQNGQVVMENDVTTGIRGVTDYGTDFGPMKVLWKSHPWTMHSPYPKGSPYWYPDTPVQWTTFFTSTGESIHDASWEPDSLLGPGSQYNSSTRSHGCIHLPLAKAQWMFDWAPVGMAVIVYPGDGSPVANQLSQITTNDQGTPTSAG